LDVAVSMEAEESNGYRTEENQRVIAEETRWKSRKGQESETEVGYSVWLLDEIKKAST